MNKKRTLTLKGDPQNLPFKRYLKQNLTYPERLLWNKLRNRQLGYKYRRQHGIGLYILDFYCPKLKLSIEIDAVTHETSLQIYNDIRKTSFLEKLGVTVIRFYNSEVVCNLEGIIEKIVEIQNKLKV